MATISISTNMVRDVTDNLSGLSLLQIVGNSTGSSSTAETLAIGYKNTINQNLSLGSIFAYLKTLSITYSNPTYYATWTAGGSNISFLDSNSQTLTTYTTNELTRTVDSNGYVILSNFPPKTPVLAGTVSSILIDTGDSKTITLTVGNPASGADIEFSDRSLITSQPWRLDGSIKFRVPVSYEYTV